MAKADMSSQYCNPAEAHFASLQDNCFVEGQLTKLMIFSEENMKQNGFAQNL